MSTASATCYGRAHGEFSRRRRPLIPMIVLAAAFIAFGPARATGETLTSFTTCDLATGEDTAFPGVAFGCETLFLTYSSEVTSNTFFFDGHQNTLSFPGGVLETFTLYMSAFYAEPEDVQFRMPEGRVCEQYSFPFSGACVYYRVEDLGENQGPPEQGTHYLGAWVQEIIWFSVDPAADADVFHAPRDANGNLTTVFGEDITVAGSYDPDPFFGDISVKDGDPLIRGSTDDFSDTIVSPAQAPEPSTLILLGVGLGGVVFRQKRRNRT